ncbi:MAG: tetratricopeptide repeat protein, partial [Acidobacteriota bacterium]
MQAQQILVEKTRVEAERDRAEAISEFLTELFKGTESNNDINRESTVQSLIDEASGRVEEGLETAPVTRVDLLFLLGNTYVTLGMDERAVELYDQCLALRQELGLEMDLQGIELRRLLAGALDLGSEGDRRRSKSLYAEVRRLATRHDEPRELVFALTGLSALAGLEEEPEKSLDFLQEAVRVIDSGADVSDDSKASVFNDLGVHYLNNSQIDKALPYLQRSVDAKESIHGPDSPQLSNALNNLAGAYAGLGRFDEAARTLERALRIHRDFYGDRSVSASVFMVNLGLYRAQGGDLEAALPLFDEAIEHFEQIQGDSSFDVAWAEQLRGTARLVAGRTDLATSKLLSPWICSKCSMASSKRGSAAS